MALRLPTGLGKLPNTPFVFNKNHQVWLSPSNRIGVWITDVRGFSRVSAGPQSLPFSLAQPLLPDYLDVHNSQLACRNQTAPDLGQGTQQSQGRTGGCEMVPPSHGLTATRPERLHPFWRGIPFWHCLISVSSRGTSTPKPSMLLHHLRYSVKTTAVL